MATQITLAELTDPMVRALLNPPGCSEEDFREAQRAGLVSSVPDPGLGRRLCPALDSVGADILAEAQRIMDVLTDDDVEVLKSDPTALRSVMQSVKWGAEMTAMVSKMRDAGLMRDCPISDRPTKTPAGRLVLALRERSR